MKKLPSNFELDRYGIHVRLVQESDAEFVAALRSDERLGKYLHKSDGDVEKQRQWIAEYKKREADGLEYYFIFDKEGQPFGLNRIYNIDWTHLIFTSGSWVCKKEIPFELPLLTSVVTDEIAFDILGLIINVFDVRKENKSVVQFDKNVVGAIQYGETELDCLFISTPESRKQSRLKKLLGLS